MRKISLISGITVLGLILVVQLCAQNLRKEVQQTARKETGWNGTRVFLPEANGAVTTVRGHGKACYFYLQYMGDNITPIGSPTLLWCESDTKDAGLTSPKQKTEKSGS